MTKRRITRCWAVALGAFCFGCAPDVEEGLPPGAAAKMEIPAAAPLPAKPPDPNKPAPVAAPAAVPAAAPAPVAATPAEPGAPAEPAMKPPVSNEDTSDAIGIPTKPAAAEGAPGPNTGSDATPPGGTREQALAGVGEKGRGYGGGIVTEPIHQYFTVQQRLTFEAQIPHALDLYKAGHNNRGPATSAKFMKEIIEANNIVLPELPPGDKYVYDPKAEQLMVEHPAR